MKYITLILVIISLIMMAIGGLSDLTNKKYIISKHHYWFDGIYLLILAFFVEIFVDCH